MLFRSVWQSASEEMYKTAQNAGPGESQQGPGQAGQQQQQQQKSSDSKSGNDEVTDVDFEEVK